MWCGECLPVLALVSRMTHASLGHLSLKHLLNVLSPSEIVAFVSLMYSLSLYSTLHVPCSELDADPMPSRVRRHVKHVESQCWNTCHPDSCLSADTLAQSYGWSMHRPHPSPQVIPGRSVFCSHTVFHESFWFWWVLLRSHEACVGYRHSAVSAHLDVAGDNHGSHNTNAPLVVFSKRN